MKLHVPDMSCGHCVAAIEKAVKSADPTAKVQTDLAARTAEIDTMVPTTSIVQVLSEAGYPSTEIDNSQ